MTTRIFCETCGRQGVLSGGEAHLPCGHGEKFYVPLNDQRTAFEAALWDRIGPPLYYCESCLRAVEVKVKEGKEPEIKRPCVECRDARIIAPRKAIMVGKGGASVRTKAQIALMKIASAITRRTVS